MGGYAFCYRTNLKSTIIPDNVTSIEADAFSGCSGLRSIIIPGSVEKIGQFAFYDCSDSCDICFEGKAPDTGSWAFPSSATLYCIAGQDGWGSGNTWNGYKIEKWNIGDVNNDGTPTAADAQHLAHYIAGFTVVTFNAANADVDLDGEITPRDSMILARHLAGWKDYATLPYKK